MFNIAKELDPLDPTPVAAVHPRGGLGFFVPGQKMDSEDLVAVFFQQMALTVAGFLIGGLAVLWWASQMGWGEPLWVWALALGAALVGAVLTKKVFEMALMVLSSVFGATLVLEALKMPAEQLSPVFVILVAAGIVIQFFSSRRQRSG